METIKCPFLEQNEVQFQFLFDTMTVEEEHRIKASRILTWMINNKGSDACRALIEGMVSVLGLKRYQLFGKMYLTSYNEEKNTFRRYFYFNRPEYISEVMNIFRVISENYSYFQQIITERN